MKMNYSKPLTTTVLAAMLTLGLGGCVTETQSDRPSKAEMVQAQTAGFKKASSQFIEDMWKRFPGLATYKGYPKYDHILTVPDKADRDATLSFVAKQRKRFSQFNPLLLSNSDKIDLAMIMARLDKLEWGIVKERSFEWDPSKYNVAGSFARLLNNTRKSEDKRLYSALSQLEAVPAYYLAAKDNLLKPTLEHTELAIQQNKAALNVLNDDLLSRAKASGLTEPQKRLFDMRLKDARAAVQDYIDYLTQRHKTLKASGEARSFRLGSELYERKFALDIQSEYTAAQMYQKALNDKKTVLRQMARLADTLWPKYFKSQRPKDDNTAISELIKKIAVKHVKRDDFVSEIRAQIPALEAFVRQKDLITLDPDKPLVVRETPEYMRGRAGASISSPGPYDKNANTYYNVTPLDGMTDEQAESYLREYNHWMMQILNIHEAIPGHYTQLVYANQSPSLIKSLFKNSAMVEGWAVYTERMMLEEGYGDFEPEMWLMYYKWNLRVIANTILDYAVHNLNMSKEEGLNLLMNEVFQEKAEAEGKWRRVTISQVQLTSYYSGFREIYDFREEQKRRLGRGFKLKAFHERFLSFGSAPVKYIKQLMRQ